MKKEIKCKKHSWSKWWWVKIGHYWTRLCINCGVIEDSKIEPFKYMKKYSTIKTIKMTSDIVEKIRQKTLKKIMRKLKDKSLNELNYLNELLN